MSAFIIRRLLLTIPTFIGVSLLAFILIHLIPGDAIDLIAGERGVSDERRAILEVKFGLDKSLPEQYWRYMVNVVRGDLGESIVTRTGVLGEFFARFPATIELSLLAMIFAIVVGLPLGILAGVRRGSAVDHLTMGAALTGYSMPIFWWALLLIFLSSVTLGWTPVSGRISLLYFFDQVTGFMLIDAVLSGQKGAFGSALHHLVLPSIVLGTIPLAVIARMTRSAMIEVLSDDYIRTARAKGVSPLSVVGVHGLGPASLGATVHCLGHASRHRPHDQVGDDRGIERRLYPHAKGVSPLSVVGVHALRNALIPVVTVIGLQVGALLADAILTETIFAWPGIGKWMIDSISRRDYPVIQGGILLIASTVILVNLAVDVLYGVINPRIRHAD